jgi:hypothetical protein
MELRKDYSAHSLRFCPFRVFLGVVESAVSPGFLLISSMWYRVEEVRGKPSLFETIDFTHMPPSNLLGECRARESGSRYY